ncbi:phosphate ABC transporter permease PstA [soil metagenome]
MGTDLDPGIPRRARFATATAAAATRSVYTPAHRADKTTQIVFQSLLLLALGLALLGLSAILIWALVEGVPRMSWSLFTNGPSTVRPESAGYRPAILGSLYVISGVIFLIIPIGVGAALYLEQYADKTRLVNRVIELNIQNLAGVPSIVFGILGLGFFVRGPLSLGFVAAVGSLTLALLVLPTIILASREAIRAVPSSISDGSLALGATQWQTIRNQVLPYAMPGILTGIILSVARAIGEAAPLLLVGAVTFVTFDPSFFNGGYSTLPVMIFQYAGRPQASFRELAAAGIIVMLIFVLFMNGYAVWLRNRYENKIG